MGVAIENCIGPFFTHKKIETQAIRQIRALYYNILLMIGRLGFLALILIGAISCSSVPRTLYRDKGLNFKVTQDFRIGKADIHKKNQATYIPIYGRDKNVYAKFSVVWILCRSDLDWEIQNYVDGLNSIYTSDTQNKPMYSAVKMTKFGSNDARQIDYIVANDGPRVAPILFFTATILQLSLDNIAQLKARQCFKSVVN
jgi:hypothetical protein